MLQEQLKKAAEMKNMKKKKLLLEDATMIDVFKTGKSFFIFFFIMVGILMISIYLELTHKYNTELNDLKTKLFYAENDVYNLKLENDCLKNNGTWETAPLQRAFIAGITFCKYKDFDYNISVKKNEQGIDITLIKNINKSNITINPFGDDPNCPHLDDPNSQFDYCLNSYLVNKNSVCFDKNKSLDFVPQNNLFQFLPAYDIQNGKFIKNIPIRDLSEIKYFCQDLNITIER